MAFWDHFLRETGMCIAWSAAKGGEDPEGSLWGETHRVQVYSPQVFSGLWTELSVRTVSKRSLWFHKLVWDTVLSIILRQRGKTILFPSGTFPLTELMFHPLRAYGWHRTEVMGACNVAEIWHGGVVICCSPCLPVFSASVSSVYDLPSFHLFSISREFSAKLLFPI